MTVFLTYTLLQSLIDPAPAVQELSVNYGLLGTLFVITLALLVGAMIYIRNDFKKQTSYLNMRLDKAETDAKEARENAEKSKTEFMMYLQNKNDFFAQIIKEYADSRDKSSMLMEKILARP
jgi:predicted histidine transporter YuiF (NhaC family)